VCYILISVNSEGHFFLLTAYTDTKSVATELSLQNADSQNLYANKIYIC
jgi:hypothetical protein